MRRVERRLAPRRQRLVAGLSGRVLEVGIGTGATITHYGADIELVGIDLSPGMLDQARDRAERLGRSVDLRPMNAENLDFPDASFDAVVFTLCLCTIPQPVTALREAVRVARPGAPIRYLEHVRSHLLPVALVQDLVNPLTVLLQHDHFNRRTGRAARDAGVVDLREERGFLGVFSLGQGHAPP